jgi:hypothetical protein
MFVIMKVITNFTINSYSFLLLFGYSIFYFLNKINILKQKTTSFNFSSSTSKSNLSKINKWRPFRCLRSTVSRQQTSPITAIHSNVHALGISVEASTTIEPLTSTNIINKYHHPGVFVQLLADNLPANQINSYPRVKNFN